MATLIRKIVNRLLAIQLIHQTYGLSGLIRFVTHTDHDFKDIHKMYFLTHFNKKYREQLVEEVRNNQEMRCVLKERLVTTIDLEKFKQLPATSLGFQYHKFVTDNHITPFKFSIKSYKNSDDYLYIALRLIALHDIYHTLLNEQTDFLGEGVVAAFTLAQLPSYVPPAIHIAAGIINTAMHLDINLDTSIKELNKGRELGKAAKLLFAVNWDDYWEKDLNHVREQFKIQLAN